VDRQGSRRDWRLESIQGNNPAWNQITLRPLDGRPRLAQTETILNNFNSSNGSYSLAPVIFDNSGNLYGTTDFGGNSGLGVVFQLMNSGGTWSENVLWSFAGGTSDGCYPYAGRT
jgi:uncharacterized repeat protein (TIGR03803 family)